MPRRGEGDRREGSRGGAGASGEGAQPPGPGLPRPSRSRLRTLSGSCARSARNNPPPSCCIANKILMSPLPLPLGRLLRSARGAGSSASRAAPGSPVRSRPRPRGLSASLAAARSPAPPVPLPASGRQPLPGLRARAPGEWGKGGREDSEVVPASRFPPGRGAVGAALLQRPQSPLRGAPRSLASCLPLPSSPARSPATAAVSLHIVRSLLPLPSPPPRLAFGLVFPHFL